MFDAEKYAVLTSSSDHFSLMDEYLTSLCHHTFRECDEAVKTEMDCYLKWSGKTGFMTPLFEEKAQEWLLLCDQMTLLKYQIYYFYGWTLYEKKAPLEQLEKIRLIPSHVFNRHREYNRLQKAARKQEKKLHASRYIDQALFKKYQHWQNRIVCMQSKALIYAGYIDRQSIDRKFGKFYKS